MAPSNKDPYQLSVQDRFAPDRQITLCLTKTGLTMHKLTVKSGQFPARDVLCAPELSSRIKAEGRRFMNQIVGRYTNRLPAGNSCLVDSAREMEKPIELNLEENDRGNCLHSGSNGYDLREFTPVDEDSLIVYELGSISPGIDDDNEFVSLAYFHLHSPAGDQGFPEAIDILATVGLELFSVPQGPDDQSIPSKTGPKNRIGRASFSLKAKLSDPEEVARRGGGTPINLTWHTGYILNDFKGHPSDVDGIHQHKLWIKSDHHLALHESQLPTGEIRPNKVLGIDFSTGNPFSEEEIKPISEIMPESGLGPISEIMPETGLDHCFLFRSSNGKGGDSLKDPKAILRSPKDDLVLSFYTNQTAVQCYSANYFDGLGSRKDLHRRSSGEPQGGYKKQEAIYLEFQGPSSLCTNVALQKNLKLLINDEDHQHLEQGDTSQTTATSNTFLYPNQVYSNWFFIDIFV